ncbi:MAG: ribosomal-processing cysteine protease Prp [Lachnospiraceae bacterium]|nr:ribosomal-processing cysteine protease Prp [Lachnospiraceae bacterium]
MIRVRVDKSHGKYKGICCEGHALFDSYGRDIVCAAVSVLVINTINSLEVISKDSFQNENDPEGGYIRVTFDRDLSHEGVILIESMILGLQSIEDNYGKRYLNLTIQEVEQC